MNDPKIDRKSLLQYGFIALPIAFAGFPLYVLAPDFYATRHGISLTLLGTLLLVIRLFDAVLDPFIGILADRRQSRSLPLLLIAGLVLCLSIFGLFNLSLVSPAVWFAFCMLFAVFAYSVLTVILGMQATLWTTDQHDLTRISASRESFALIGLVIAVSTPQILSGFLNQEVIYIYYTAIIVVLMAVGLVFFFRAMTKIEASAVKKNGASLSLSSAWRALPIESLRLFAVYGLGMLASSIPAVLVIFYVRDLLGAEHLTGFFLLLYFLSGAAAMPLWKSISTRIGKHQTWALSNILAVSGFIGAYFLGSGDVWAYAVVCLVSGLALGADLTLPPSILADQIHAGRNSAFAGTHYALLAFIAKACLAVASAIALPVLDAAGFAPNAANSASALATLSAAYALIPCALKLAAAASLYIFFIRPQSDGRLHSQ
ncbi:MAG TPA: MFS transporter [Azospirillaceae bacterium]|nr:MFS transporter [Azospirillaceae bacterium]HRQ79603.1 MFS transporter [Azospirillaceae bacterium]